MAGIPKCAEKFFDSMTMWKDGTLVLCASNLCGRYWSGSVWCFKSVTDVPSMEKCITGVETDSGPCDVASLGQGKILIGLDTGAVEILSLEGDPLILNSKFYSAEHDDFVSSVDVLGDNTKAISGSYDFGIKIWDLEANCSIATYKPAHANVIHQVASCKTHPNIFLSCSQDFKVKLWDSRAGYKGCIGNFLVTCNSDPVAPTAIAWQQDSLVYAAGTEDGRLLFGDLRYIPVDGETNGVKLNLDLNKLDTHTHKVKRISFNPNKPKWVASCADNCDIVVTDLSDMESPVHFFSDSSSHSHCVRDLLWDVIKEDQLISCSWDSTVCSHEIKRDSAMETNGF